MKTIFEKSIVSARDLKSGEVITFSDLAYKKPGNGIPASCFKDVIGKRINVDISKNEKLSWLDFQ